MSKCSADWFLHPVAVRDVCQILKEAVMEREQYFNMVPDESYYPLTVPDPPLEQQFHKLSVGGCAANARHLNNFGENLRQHISRLLQYTFDPRSFGQWSDYQPFASWDTHEAFLEAMGIDLDGYFMRNIEPFCPECGRFFHAAAEVLNRCVLYPAIKFRNNFAHKSGCSFGENADLTLTDLLTGADLTGPFQPDGALTLVLPDGVKASAAPRYAGYYSRRRDRDGIVYREYRRMADNWRIFCQAAENSDEPGGTLQMRGEFDIRINISASIRLWDSDNKSFQTAADSAECELTIRPLGISDVPDFSPWQNQIQRAVNPGSGVPEDLYEYDTYVIFDITSPQIRLMAENYPDLPYKYLT